MGKLFKWITIYVVLVITLAFIFYILGLILQAV